MSVVQPFKVKHLKVTSKAEILVLRYFLPFFEIFVTFRDFTFLVQFLTLFLRQKKMYFGGEFWAWVSTHFLKFLVSSQSEVVVKVLPL